MSTDRSESWSSFRVVPLKPALRLSSFDLPRPKLVEFSARAVEAGAPEVWPAQPANLTRPHLRRSLTDRKLPTARTRVDPTTDV
jgi:hypothetical protein